MARKSSRNSADAQFNMTAAVDVSAAPVESTDTILSGLLDQLDEVEAGAPALTGDAAEIIEAAEAADELIEQVSAESADTVASMNAEAADEPLDAVDSLLDEVAGDAARIEAKQELYAEQGADAAAAAGDAPATDPAELTDSKKKGKKKTTAPKEPKAPKEPRATSVTHKPGDLLKHKLGTAAAEVLVFDLNDAALDADGLAAKQQAFVDRMNDPDSIADKVKDKIQMFLVWMTKGGELNEVLKRAITVLHEKGELTSGDKGNLQLNLLAKPYSLGTARSQANQMFMALPELGITIKEKGRMIPNPDSALLPMAKTKLGLV